MGGLQGDHEQDHADPVCSLVVVVVGVYEATEECEV